MITRSKVSIFKPRTFIASLLRNPQIPALSLTVPESVAVALTLPDWKLAMDNEYNALIQNGTWSLVPFQPHMHVVDHKWVFRVKFHSDGSVQRLKARLVAKGFQQQPGVDFAETFSPVVKPSTIRVMLSLAATYDWEIQQIDIDNAFLHSILFEDVYMSQPVGYINSEFPTAVCKLHKAIYGLKQAPRAWFDTLRIALLQLGLLNSVSDSSLFYLADGDARLYVLVYVDDILLTGNNSARVLHIIS